MCCMCAQATADAVEYKATLDKVRQSLQPLIGSAM